MLLLRRFQAYDDTAGNGKRRPLHTVSLQQADNGLLYPVGFRTAVLELKRQIHSEIQQLFIIHGITSRIKMDAGSAPAPKRV